MHNFFMSLFAYVCVCVSCAGNAIQAFGYGTDAGLVPITESQSAVPSVRTNLQPAIITKHVINSNDVKQIDSACVFSTCANLQVGLNIFVVLYIVVYYYLVNHRLEMKEFKGQMRSFFVILKSFISHL